MAMAQQKTMDTGGAALPPPESGAAVYTGMTSSPALTPLEAQLRRVPLFSGLEDGALRSLVGVCRRRRFRNGETLFHEGDPGQTLYIVLSGYVNIERVNREMETVHIAQRGVGEHFGEMALLDDLPRSADAVTGTECELLMLDRRELLQFLGTNPSVAWNIIRALSARLRESTEQTLRNGTLDVMGRLADFLTQQATGIKPDAAGHYPLPRLTDEQIASRIGATRETVNRSLARLKRMQAVRRDGRMLIVTDLTRLRQMSAAA